MRVLAGTNHYTPTEALRALGITRAQLYGLVRVKKLQVTWYAGRLYVPALEIERFLREETERTTDRIATKLVRAMGERVRLVYAWHNGHGRP